MYEDPIHKLPQSQDDALSQILGAVQNLSNRVGGLEQKVEERLYDTRPVWEKVQANIAQLQDGQKSLAESQKRFEEKLVALHDEMRTGFRNLKRQFSILNDTFLEVRADYKDLDTRVYKLEGERT